MGSWWPKRRNPLPFSPSLTHSHTHTSSSFFFPFFFPSLPPSLPISLFSYSKFQTDGQVFSPTSEVEGNISHGETRNHSLPQSRSSQPRLVSYSSVSHLAGLGQILKSISSNPFVPSLLVTLVLSSVRGLRRHVEEEGGRGAGHTFWDSTRILGQTRAATSLSRGKKSSTAGHD